MRRQIAGASRNRLLRFAFAPALGWAIVLAFSEDMESILQMYPVPEGRVLHGLLEIAGVLGIVATAGLVRLFVYRHWTGFLLLERPVSWLPVVWRLLIYAPLAFIATGIIFFSFRWLFVVGGEDPAHSQYGLSAWVAGFCLAIMLTPLLTMIWVWWSLERKYNKR